MVWIAVPVAIALAGYTAFLFGQAEARDLWQSPMLLWHMVAGALAAGGGAMLLLGAVTGADETLMRSSAWAMTGGALALGLIALVEITSHHPTRNIAMAIHHMTKGAFARQWWIGGQLIGVVVPVSFGSGYLWGSPLWVALSAPWPP
jgi:formate-dependent nitrite reductase membrane component NrfD